MNIYSVWLEGSEDEVETVESDSENAAAEEFADFGGYDYDCTVCVQDQNGIVTRWHVACEIEITYSAVRAPG